MIGRPAEYAQRYCRVGWELLFMDVVASLYGRNQIGELLDATSESVTRSGNPVPITVGGGIKSLSEADRLFRCGADQVAVNTGALERPRLINEIAERYGSQALVVSVEAQRVNGGWEARTDNGRQATGRDVRDWIDEAIDRGAGEILLTSCDMEGTQRGFDLELIRAVAPTVPVPLIACGGCGSIEHIRQAKAAGADGVAVASVLHYEKLTTQEIDAEIGV